MTVFQPMPNLPALALERPTNPGRLPSLPSHSSHLQLPSPHAQAPASTPAYELVHAPNQWEAESESTDAEALDSLHRDCVVAAVQREELLRRAVRLGAHCAARRKEALGSAPAGTAAQRHSLAASRSAARSAADDLAERMRAGALALVEAVARWRHAVREQWRRARETSARAAGAVPTTLLQMHSESERLRQAVGPSAAEEGGGHWPSFQHGGVPYLGKALGDLHVVGAALPQLLSVVASRGKKSNMG